MTRALGLILALLFCIEAPCLAAPGDPASDASIEEYLKVSNAQQLVEKMKSQVTGLIANSVQQASQGKSLPPERQAIVDHMAQEMSDLLAQTLSWDTLKPMYMRIYHESFTQSEMDGIIHFYKSPAGKAMVNKVPVVMQNVMTEMQAMIKPMQQKMIQIQREATDKLKATQDQ